MAGLSSLTPTTGLRENYFTLVMFLVSMYIMKYIQTNIYESHTYSTSFHDPVFDFLSMHAFFRKVDFLMKITSTNFRLFLDSVQLRRKQAQCDAGEFNFI